MKEWALSEAGRNTKLPADGESKTNRIGWTYQDKVNEANENILRTSLTDNRQWKSFNNFENDKKFKHKQMLRDEISNITMRIIKAREA